MYYANKTDLGISLIICTYFSQIFLKTFFHLTIKSDTQVLIRILPLSLYLCNFDFMAKKIILITGGERSGKSSYAEERVQQMDPNPVYLATARIWDEEFRLRVRMHQERRGKHWINIEEPLELSNHHFSGHAVLVDCLTLWATNFFFRASGNETESNAEEVEDAEKARTGQETVQRVLQDLKEEFDRLICQDATFLFVTNEIGSGGISPDPIQRRFTDLLGWLNQYVAQKADEVILMVSGIPVKIK